jgi:hypothetical protein
LLKVLSNLTFKSPQVEFEVGRREKDFTVKMRRKGSLLRVA